jgi:prepilin-type N-terminal cleavage/methylation domain-containing protein
VFERYRELQERRASGESEGGFTLIELLIVIIVLGILAAIVIFSLTGVSGQSQVAACNTDAKSVQTAVQAYETQNSGNPPANMAALVGTYLHQAPSATTTSQGYAISLDTTTLGQVDVSTSTVTNASYDTAGCASA